MIEADAQQDEADKDAVVRKCQADYTKSVTENVPDFGNIRAALKNLTDAQADAQAVWVNAYEKAYAVLTDAQKTRLEFLRATRQHEIEQRAEAASEVINQQPSQPAQGPSSPLQH